VRFVKKETALQFQFDVPIDADIVMTKKPDQQAQKTDETAQTGQTARRVRRVRRAKLDRGGKHRDREVRVARGGAPPAPPRTKTLYFEYDLATSKVQLLEDYKPPERKPTWANVSPDGKTIIFARNHNLYMMDDVNYEKAKKTRTTLRSSKRSSRPTALSITVSVGVRGAVVDQQQQQERNHHHSRSGARVKEGEMPVRRRSPSYWSKDSKKFCVRRTDDRKVSDLWVINTLANPRPTLLTYRYAMPGEANVPQEETPDL